MSEEPSYGSRGYFRERGTLRIVLWAVAIAVVWFLYSWVHVMLMERVKWPPLKPDPAGLTVLGLQDVAHGSYMPPYRAIEAEHAWQIRRTDIGEAEQEASQAKGNQGDEDSQARTRATPAGSVSEGRGPVVPLSELYAKLPTVLTGKDFIGANIVPRTDAFFDRKYYLLNLTLSDEGRSRLFQYSLKHSGERIAFVLKGLVMFCPRISNTDARTVTIDPVWVHSDAQTMADFVNGRK